MGSVRASWLRASTTLRISGTGMPLRHELACKRVQRRYIGSAHAYVERPRSAKSKTPVAERFPPRRRQYELRVTRRE